MDTKTQIVKSLASAQVEATQLANDEPNAWVVCFASDLSPFRLDGTRIQLGGEDGIWFTHQEERMREVMRNLNAQTSHTIIAMLVKDWSEARIKKLGELIEYLKGA